MGDENNTNSNAEDNILTLDYVKNYLRIDHHYDDEFLRNCMQMSLLYAKNRLGDRLNDVKKNADIQQALLYHIAQIYQNKTGEKQAPEASNEIYDMYRDVKIGL